MHSVMQCPLFFQISFRTRTFWFRHVRPPVGHRQTNLRKLQRDGSVHFVRSHCITAAYSTGRLTPGSMRAASGADGVVTPERSTPLPAVAEVNDSEDGEESEESAADAAAAAAEADEGAADNNGAPSSGVIAGAAAAATTGAAGVASQFGYGSKTARPGASTSGAKPAGAAQGMQRAVPAEHAGSDDALLEEASATAAAASSQLHALPAVAGAALPLAAPAATAAAVGPGASAEGLSPIKAGPATARQDDLEGLSPNSLAAGADFADLVTSLRPCPHPAGSAP